MDTITHQTPENHAVRGTQGDTGGLTGGLYPAHQLVKLSTIIGKISFRGGQGDTGGLKFDIPIFENLKNDIN